MRILLYLLLTVLGGAMVAGVSHSFDYSNCRVGHLAGAADHAVQETEQPVWINTVGLLHVSRYVSWRRL